MIYRVDVRAKDGNDPLGDSVQSQIAELGFGVGKVETSRIYLIDTYADCAAAMRIAREVLCDPVVEIAELLDSAGMDGSAKRIEVHLKPGVMDPVAASTEMAIRDLGMDVRQVRTGRAYLIEGNLNRAELSTIAGRVLANGVIESVHFDRFCPERFESGREEALLIRHVPLQNLSEAELTKLSRDGHLFLSLDEMKAIQNYFRGQNREPTDIELETIAQTWSEHCVHKTLKSAVKVKERDESGRVTGTREYGNLIKETIFASTTMLMERQKGEPFCLSVFKDNAGVVAFDDVDAVCFKVETHNHPSAIEPYGGSATGAGGVIRDILGTGLAAKPVANTDVFCVAYPKRESLPRGVIHPKRVLQQVVAGVRDYGNRMGIPTVNGAVYFDDRYLGNPLVFCGCVGIIPRDKIQKGARKGDAIVLMGGRTGRDGIHGATFSSAELTDTHADEFSHAVQIGNAITEKKVADVILEARDRELFTAVTDCGAGGLSSAVGEMGEKTGAAVDLDKAPLKYAGLRYDEVWISEAQERMVLSVPADKVEELLKLSRAEDVEATVIGTFGTPGDELVLRFGGTEVGRISMHFLHDGIPMPARKAVVVASSRPSVTKSAPPSAPIRDRLLATLAHPNIASKHWIIRQYDHEVQGGSVIKPLVGPLQRGPSDAAVLRPKLGSRRGVVVSCGMAPQIEDPYEMALASIDEAIRNAVAVGGNPDRMAILDNFCWPSVDDEVTMGTLVRACEACRDAALAYGIPFISGKDSLHNQFTNKETGEVLRIPRTLLISAIGVIEDVRKCVSMDLKLVGAPVFLVAVNRPNDLVSLAKFHRAVARMIAEGHVTACHDVSDGGAITAAAEMCIASGKGLTILDGVLIERDVFAEHVGQYLVEVSRGSLEVFFDGKLAGYFEGGATLRQVGFVQTRPSLMIFKKGDTLSKTAVEKGELKILEEVSIDDLTSAWRGTLDW
jgi:phosphoribosylformylglycinamidine synthase subunit PurSL